MAKMTAKQMDDLLRGPHIARVAKIDEEGAPHVTPAWYDWDGKSIFLVGRKKSSWVNHIQKDPRVTVLIDEVGPPEFKIVLKGKGEIVETDWYEIARRMSIHYFGNETGLSYIEESRDQPRQV